MTLLALIPARGGSKGIPRKNVKRLAGKPLIAHTIIEAKKCLSIDRVVVSTEDREIAEISRDYGAEIPFLRPQELSEDTTPTMDVVWHILEKLEDVTTILLLQPTSPLRTAVEIEGIINYHKKLGGPSVVSITEQDKHPNWMYYLDKQGKLVPMCQEKERRDARRQDLKKCYALNGAMYICTRDWLTNKKGFVERETEGYIMDKETSIDIDTEFDWKLAEMIMRSQKK